MSLSGDSGRSWVTLPILDCGRVAVKRTRTRRVAKLCLKKDPTPLIKIERTYLLIRTGQQGNVYQADQLGKWNPRSSAYGRFWIDVPDGERARKTVSLGLCATQWVARLRLREIHRASRCLFQAQVSPDPSSRVLHFGSRPNGGWSLSLRVDGGRSNPPRSMDGSIAWIDGFYRTLATS